MYNRSRELTSVAISNEVAGIIMLLICTLIKAIKCHMMYYIGTFIKCALYNCERCTVFEDRYCPSLYYM